jgi:DnaK suppressor protein
MGLASGKALDSRAKPGAEKPSETGITRDTAQKDGTREHGAAQAARRPDVKAPAKKSTSKAKAAPKAAAKKPAAKPVAKKPVLKAPAKPAAKAAAKKAPSAKPAAKSTKPVAKPAKPAAKPLAKTAAKKPVAPQKPTPKASPAAKAMPKSAAPTKTSPKGVAKTTAKPAVTKPMQTKTPISPPLAAAVAKPAIPVKPPVPVAPVRKPSKFAPLVAPVTPMVASVAAKASYQMISSPTIVNPSPPTSVKRDPKLVNNWKTKSADQLTDDEVIAMPDSEYMNDKQMAFFRRKLVQLKQEILDSADQTTEHLREDNVVVPDPADRATIEEEHALELRTRDRERKLLKKIEQSIGRIDAGDYGYCDETGEPIGVGRLLARPTATLSLEAQQRRELKQKMFGD